MKQIYICFLRGINVSGKNMIKMKDLAHLFQQLGFSDISTYLQSGNVVFRAGEDISKEMAADKIAKGIAESFRFSVPVLVKSKADMNVIFNGNPFINEKGIEPDKLHVTMLDAVPGKQKTEALSGSDFTPERFVISGQEIFLFCPDGYGRAKLNNNFLENKLGVMATTRNWRTITSLNDMANSML